MKRLMIMVIIIAFTNLLLSQQYFRESLPFQFGISMEDALLECPIQQLEVTAKGENGFYAEGYFGIQRTKEARFFFDSTGLHSMTYSIYEKDYSSSVLEQKIKHFNVMYDKYKADSDSTTYEWIAKNFEKDTIYIFMTNSHDHTIIIYSKRKRSVK